MQKAHSEYSEWALISTVPAFTYGLAYRLFVKYSYWL